MRGSFIKNLHRAFATGVFLLLISSIASFIAIRESYKRADWVYHTEKVKSKLEVLMSTLKDAETGVRGYIITGDSAVLEPYYGAYKKTSQAFDHIKGLTSDNSQQQNDLPVLRKLIEFRFHQLNKQIARKREQKLIDDRWVIEGKATMDEIRRLVYRMQQREDMLLERRDLVWKSYRQISPLLIVLIAITGTIMAYHFCSHLKKSYYRNAQLQKILQQEKIETDKRIKLLSSIADQISNGNYRLRLQEKDSDLLGGLSASLNKMTVSLEYSFDALKELMAKKDDFISIAAHELKTPLTSIKAYLQFIGRVKLEIDESKKIYPFVSKANSQVNKLAEIIKDLLDVTRINEGQLALLLSDFSVREALLDVSEEIFASVKTHELIIEGEPDIIVRADKFRIEQVLINLISNAIKYSPGRKHLVAEVKKEGNFAKISIRDSGIGIPQEQLPYIFERYFRVEQTAQNYAGMGLGLFISKGIIERHGGKITASSTFGEGSVFSFTLPLSEGELPDF